MDKGGWVYIMADRYRGTMYVGVTANLAARIYQHRTGTGSDFCRRYGLDRLVWAEAGDDIQSCITHEKRVKRWSRSAIPNGSTCPIRSSEQLKKRDPGSGPGRRS